MNTNERVIYTLGPPRHARLPREYATTPEEIKQMAKDRLWGTACAFPVDWTVDVDMETMVVTIFDPVNPGCGKTKYKILAYGRLA